VEITELYIVVVLFSPWKSVFHIPSCEHSLALWEKKYNFAYDELTLYYYQYLQNIL